MKAIKKSDLIAFFIFVIFVGFIFFITPTTEIDLVKYYGWLDEYSLFKWKDLLNHTQINNIVIDLIFWFIAKSGKYVLLPLMTGMIVYGVAFWIVRDAAKRWQVQSKFYLYYVFLMCGTLFYGFIISNVRNVIAFAVIAVALYRDLILKKKNFLTGVLYIVPCGIHISVLVLIFARMIIPVYKKVRFIGIFFALLTPVIVKAVFSILNAIEFDNLFLGLIVRFVDKAYYYFFNFDQGWKEQVLNSGFQQVLKIYSVFLVILLQLMLMRIIKYTDQMKPYKTYCYFVELLGLLTLSSFYIPIPTYLRFMVLYIILFSPIYMMMTCVCLKKGRIENVLFYGSYVSIICMGIVIQSYYMFANFAFSFFKYS